MRRRAIAVGLLLLPLSVAFALPEPYRVLSSFTLPPTFYVGDHVELRVRLEIANPGAVRLPARMPSNSWIRINSMSLVRGSGSVELRIFFASYAPGDVVMPPIDLGPFTVTGLKVQTASLTAGGAVTHLTEPKRQMLLPGSTLYVAVLIAVLAAIPTLAFVLFGRLLPYLGRILSERRARRPWRRFLAALARLEKAGASRSARDFYIELCAEIRTFLGALTGGNFSAMTAREFSRSVGTVGLSVESQGAFGSILSFGDLVKFAGEEAGAEERTRDVSGARAAGSALEEQRRARATATRLRGRRNGGVKPSAASVAVTRRGAP